MKTFKATNAAQVMNIITRQLPEQYGNLATRKVVLSIEHNGRKYYFAHIDSRLGGGGLHIDISKKTAEELVKWYNFESK